MRYFNNFKKSKIYVKYSQVKRQLYINLGIYDEKIIQLANTTRMNRHPDLFTKCCDIKGKYSQINILSFGCSTGEECFSLREYFPYATIIGFDVNRSSLKTAERNNRDNKIRFVSNIYFIKFERFYLIFVISVLCREPEGRILTNISKIFPFNDFNQILIKLVYLLKLGGCFVIRNSNYRFEDSTIFEDYLCLYSSLTSFPVFSKNGLKLSLPVQYSEILLKNLKTKGC